MDGSACRAAGSCTKDAGERTGKLVCQRWMEEKREMKVEERRGPQGADTQERLARRCYLGSWDEDNGPRTRCQLQPIKRE